jgi:hypothetical protein
MFHTPAHKVAPGFPQAGQIVQDPRVGFAAAPKPAFYVAKSGDSRYPHAVYEVMPAGYSHDWLVSMWVYPEHAEQDCAERNRIAAVEVA